MRARLARQVTLLGAEAQERIENGRVTIPKGLEGASYAERYVRGAGVATVSVTKGPPPEGPPFEQLLDVRSRELLRGAHFALSELRRLLEPQAHRSSPEGE